MHFLLKFVTVPLKWVGYFIFQYILKKAAERFAKYMEKRKLEKEKKETEKK